MELWIRSQDKEILVKIKNISIASNQDGTCEIINEFEEHSCYELGIYKSKERALEVLNEIQNILEHEWDYKDKISMCRVYEMPKD